MANFNLSAQTAVIGGVPRVHASTATAMDTVTILGPAGKPLDFANLHVRIQNTNVAATDQSVVCTIKASSSYSSLSQGDYSFNIAASGANSIVYLGGKGLDSARFKQVSTQSLLLQFTLSSTTATALSIAVEAVQGPYNVTA
jgi:hypothetical protein